jgi:aspartyl-tRNA(Asn)/glutamyl-tRNA(Gln) amidotransferase subunit A
MVDAETRPLKELAHLMRSGRLRSVELVERAAARYAVLDARLRAFACWDGEGAGRTARAADAAFAEGRDLGPLQGVPVSVKDLYGVPGLPTFAGTSERLPERFERAGPIVRRLLDGLVPITGKTHTVELAFGGLGVNEHHGTPCNPWDAAHARVPGGSSAGAGVSLWEGAALVALGTDTAGSVRIPASMTGTVGLKTTPGRWSTAGIVPLSSTLDTAGLLARTVADAAWAFAGLDPSSQEPRQFGEPLDLSGLRVGLPRQVLWDDCSPGVEESVRAALGELERAGAVLRDVDLPEAEEAVTLLRMGSVAAVELDEFLEAELPGWRERLQPIVGRRLEQAGELTAREYLGRRRRLRELACSLHARFDDLDLLAGPTVPLTPPRLDELADAAAYAAANGAALRNTCLASFTGACALSLPAGLDAAGLPVGLQLIAPGGAEERLLGLGVAAERVLGTARQRLGTPPLAETVSGTVSGNGS